MKSVRTCGVALSCRITTLPTSYVCGPSMCYTRLSNGNAISICINSVSVRSCSTLRLRHLHRCGPSHNSCGIKACGKHHFATEHSAHTDHAGSPAGTEQLSPDVKTKVACRFSAEPPTYPFSVWNPFGDLGDCLHCSCMPGFSLGSTLLEP